MIFHLIGYRIIFYPDVIFLFGEGPVAIQFQSQPTYIFLVVAFCTFVSFEGCVGLIFIPKMIAVLYYDPVKFALIESIRICL